MEKVIDTIKIIRKEKGFSHEYMAHMLNISQVAYSKIEKYDTKLTVERLYKIAEILDAKIEDVLDIKADKSYNQDLKDQAIGHQEIQNMYHDNKEYVANIEKLHEIRSQEKDEQIAFLKLQVERLMR
jgi:transcriptional regulator with XRE-family HTH domain